MRPFHFGKPQSPLFGIHHPPAAPRARVDDDRVGAVLLCNPFGQEAIRAHMVYAVLADKLSRLGLHVLRFDYTGTGDSSGEVEEGNQALWIDDIIAAHDQLSAVAEVNRIAWVGLRYGATLAVLAAEKLPRPLVDVVLWDPVVSGAAYVGELIEMHHALMRIDLANWKPGADAGKEALGFPIGPQLRAAMSAVDLAGAPPRAPRSGRLTVIASRQAPDLDRLKRAVAGWDVPSRWLDVAAGAAWSSGEAMSAALIPTNVVEHIVACIHTDG
jgi:alpha/beta superfamily hydrolase